jgi:hypothetical protein
MEHIKRTEIKSYTCDICEKHISEPIHKQTSGSCEFDFCPECNKKLPKWVKDNEFSILTSIYNCSDVDIKELINPTRKCYCIFDGEEDSPRFKGFNTLKEMEEYILDFDGSGWLSGVVIDGKYKTAEVKEVLSIVYGDD